jgi:hypothetical protein
MHHALQTAATHASVADLLLLEAWETDRAMDLGVMLRVRQIRRANPLLSQRIAAELQHGSVGVADGGFALDGRATMRIYDSPIGI